MGQLTKTVEFHLPRVADANVLVQAGWQITGLNFSPATHITVSFEWGKSELPTEKELKIEIPDEWGGTRVV